jgi:hypothetical protein
MLTTKTPINTSNKGESKSSTSTDSKIMNQDNSPVEQDSLIQKYRDELLKIGARKLHAYKKYNLNLEKALEMLSNPSEKEKNASTLLAGYPVNNPFGLMVHAMEALSSVSKESAGFLSGAETEAARKGLLAAFNDLMSSADTNMSALEDKQKQLRDAKVEQLEKQLQDEKSTNERLVEKNDTLKQLNEVLKKQVEKHEQEGQLYDKISSSLSEIGSIVSNANRRSQKPTVVPSADSVVPMSRRGSAPSTITSINSKKSERKERNLAEDCARMMQYWSPERVFLSAVLTDAVCYNPQDNRLQTIFKGLESDSTLQKIAGMDSLVSYFKEYLKQPQPSFSEEEKASLYTRLMPLIRGLYKQEISPEEAIKQLAEWKKLAASSDPRFIKKLRFFMPAIEKLSEIVTSPAVDPVLSQEIAAAKNLKCYRLLKDGSFLPPLSADGVATDVQIFQKQHKQLTNENPQAYPRHVNG